MRPLLEMGEVVNGTYTISEKIGAGAFSDVYLVNHRFLGQQAMKVFHQTETKSDQRTANVDQTFVGLPNKNLEEARLLVDLSHSHIVRVYDANVFERSGKLFSFMTMEYASGGTLEAIIANRTRLSVSSALGICAQITEALAHTHSLTPPLIHRDIKPSNVLITSLDPEIQLKVSDFGLASTLDPRSRLSQSAGTLSFAPPEMVWGVADERTDVYSVGVTLYRIVTGIHPFPVASLQEVRASREFTLVLDKGRRSIQPPSRLLLHEQPKLDALLMKALSFDMFSRQRNAVELLDEITRVQTDVHD